MSKTTEAKAENTKADIARTKTMFIVINQTVDWPAQIADIAGQYTPRDNKGSWLQRAANLSGVSFWHCQQLYENKLDPKWSIASKIIIAAEKARRKAQQDASHLAIAFQTTAAALERTDPNFHRGTIDALRAAASEYGVADST